MGMSMACGGVSGCNAPSFNYVLDILGDGSTEFYYPISECSLEEVITGNPDHTIVEEGASNTRLLYNNTTVPALNSDTRILVPISYPDDVSSTFSYSILIKIDSFISGTRKMEQSQHTNGTVIIGSSNVYGLYVYQNKLYYSEFIATSNFKHIDFGDISNIADGLTHSLILSIDYNSSIDLYIDGTLIHSESVSYTPSTRYPKNHYIDFHQNGDITFGDFRFYNRTLIQTDVNNIISYY